MQDPARAVYERDCVRARIQDFRRNRRLHGVGETPSSTSYAGARTILEGDGGESVIRIAAVASGR